jgi:hypothetical protein
MTSARKLFEREHRWNASGNVGSISEDPWFEERNAIDLRYPTREIRGEKLWPGDD